MTGLGGARSAGAQQGLGELSKVRSCWHSCVFCVSGSKESEPTGKDFLSQSPAMVLCFSCTAWACLGRGWLCPQGGDCLSSPGSLEGWLRLSGIWDRRVSIIRRKRTESISGAFDILLSRTLVMALITISKSTTGWKAKGRNK